MREKRKYNKRQKWVKWTDEEKFFILENPEMTPRKLWANLGKTRTINAVSCMRYNLLNKK